MWVGLFTGCGRSSVSSSTELHTDCWSRDVWSSVSTGHHWISTCRLRLSYVPYTTRGGATVLKVGRQILSQPNSYVCGVDISVKRRDMSNMCDMNYPQIMFPLSSLPLKVGLSCPHSSCGSAAHVHNAQYSTDRRITPFSCSFVRYFIGDPCKM